MLDNIIALMFIVGVFLAAGIVAAGVQKVLARITHHEENK